MTEFELMRELMDLIYKGNDWFMSLGRGDQTEQLARLTVNLQAPVSPSGDGKQFASGFSYLGIESTLAWARASNDLMYPVMKTSIETFSRRWAAVRAALGTCPHHYVSYGPGTGQKDDLLLSELNKGDGGALSYIPIDMSENMLQLAERQVRLKSTMPHHRIAPLQLDFSRLDNLESLRTLLHEGLGQDPILFSLLGNTMSNFPEDEEVLANIGSLLRPQDRLLLEVATTDSLTDEMAQEAAREYAGTLAFREFVTSALLHYTDLHIDMDSVSFASEVEDDRALLIKGLYRNDTDKPVRLTLPDRSKISFPAGDTIRLVMMRKYSHAGLAGILRRSGLKFEAENYWNFATHKARAPFGMALLLLSKTQNDPEMPAVPEVPRLPGQDIWKS